METVLRLEQPENAHLPIAVTELGITILVKLQQSTNAYSLMVMTESPMVILAKFLHFSKAQSPISMTEWGISMLSKLEQQERFNERDNQTKIMVAQINHTDDGIEEPYSIEAQEKLKESMRQFNETMQFNRDKLALDKHKVELDASLKRQALSKKPSNNTNK